MKTRSQHLSVRLSGVASRAGAIGSGFFLCGALFPLWAQPLFPFKTITFYSGEAQVHREATLDLAAGFNALQLIGLPDGLREDSLELRVDRPEIEIKAIRIAPRNVEGFHSEKARNARQFFEEARLHLEKLTREYQVLKEEEKSLSALRIVIPEPRQKIELDSRSWEANLEFIQGSLARNQNRMLELLDRIDQARVDFRIAETLLSRYQSAEARRVKDLSFALETPRPGKTRISLTYRLGGASWFPAYGARVSSTGSTASLKLTLYALARNESGEDWENTNFAFSAARPPSSGALPDLAEWRIRAAVRPGIASPAPAPYAEEDAPAIRAQDRMRRAPSSRRGSGSAISEMPALQSTAPARPKFEAKKKNDYYEQNLNIIQDERARQNADAITGRLEILENSKRTSQEALKQGRYGEAVKDSNAFIESLQSLPPRAQALFADDLEEARQLRRRSLEMLEAERIIARLRSPAGFDHEFKAAFAESIPSDNSFHKIFLLEKELPVELAYEVAAEKSRYCFLTGEARNAGQDPLLYGPASVYHNQDYAGESIIESTASGQAFRLYLGADEDIQVERSTTAFRERAGLLGNDYRYRHRISLQLVNKKRLPARVTLLERLPFSTDEKLQIEGLSTSRNPDKRDPSGLMAFALTLGPGEKQSTQIEYSLRYPAGSRPVYSEQGAPTW